MFVDRLSQIDVERQFMPPIHQSTIFNNTIINGESTIVFMYKSLMTPEVKAMLLTDFAIDGVESKEYLIFMRDMFGEEYEHEYFKYKTK